MQPFAKFVWTLVYLLFSYRTTLRVIVYSICFTLSRESAFRFTALISSQSLQLCLFSPFSRRIYFLCLARSGYVFDSRLSSSIKVKFHGNSFLVASS